MDRIVILVENKKYADKAYINPTYLVVNYESQGSGFFVDAKNGLFLTNYHVVHNSALCQISLPLISGHKFNAKIISYSEKKDVALCQVIDLDEFHNKVNYKELDVEFMDSFELRDNEFAYAYGNPTTGFEYCDGYTKLYHSSQFVNMFDPELVYITLPIKPGYSGSPLFNSDNKVIGMNTFSVSDNTSYAVTSRTIFSLWNELTNDKNYQKNIDSPTIDIYYTKRDMKVIDVSDVSCVKLPKDAIIHNIWFNNYIDKYFKLKLNSKFKPNGIINIDKNMKYKDIKLYSLKAICDSLPYSKNINVEYSLKNKVYIKQFKNSVVGMRIPTFDISLDKLDYVILSGMMICELNTHLLTEMLNNNKRIDLSNKLIIVCSLLTDISLESITTINSIKVNSLSDLRYALTLDDKIDIIYGKDTNLFYRMIDDVQKCTDNDRLLYEQFNIDKSRFVLL